MKRSNLCDVDFPLMKHAFLLYLALVILNPYSYATAVKIENFDDFDFLLRLFISGKHRSEKNKTTKSNIEKELNELKTQVTNGIFKQYKKNYKPRNKNQLLKMFEEDFRSAYKDKA